MSPAARKPLGALAIIAFVAAWALGIAHFAGTIGRWPIVVQLLFYLVAGVGWVLPLRPALRWMETGRWRAPPPPAS
jgi:hypothetical protein